MTSDGLGVDVGTTGGSWLFKQSGVLLGPVPFTKLVELLFEGEIDEDTPVAPFNLEPKFQPLGKVEKFRVHLAKAQAKLRVEDASQTMKRELRTGRIRKTAAVAGVGIVLLVGVISLASYLAIHQPWKDKIAMLEPVITDELPSIGVASTRTDEDELAYDPVAGTAKPGANPRGARGQAQSRNGAAGPAASNGSRAPAATAVNRGASDNDVGVVQMWNQDEINAVVKSKKATLHSCLKAEAERQKPGWSERIPLEFTIGNDGRITKLWIDKPDYKSQDSELYKCMFAELRKWQFSKYEGELASIQLAFNISKPLQ